MIRIKELKIALDEFEDNDMAYAYSGEIIGIIIKDGNSNKEIGHIIASEYDDQEGDAYQACSRHG